MTYWTLWKHIRTHENNSLHLCCKWLWLSWRFGPRQLHSNFSVCKVNSLFRIVDLPWCTFMEINTSLKMFKVWCSRNLFVIFLVIPFLGTIEKQENATPGTNLSLISSYKYLTPICLLIIKQTLHILANNGSILISLLSINNNTLRFSAQYINKLHSD